MSSLRLRPGLHYAPVTGGVYFSTARSTFVVKGPAVLFRLVDICVPLLEDGAGVDQLVAATGTPAARPAITRLLDAFDSRGLLLHLDHLLTAEPGLEERESFPATLAYLETHCDDPYSAFRSVRDARVLVAGPADAVSPAVRGLLRAGVGQLLVASDDPERLASLAARRAAVTLLAYRPDELPWLKGDSVAQVAVIFSEDTFPAETIERLPASCTAVPVRLGKDLAIVGPVVRPGGERGPAIVAAESFWERSGRWCRLDGDDLLVRPSGDLLAGALAGQLALDTLVGLNPGQVHLVHGPDLSSDSITPDRPAPNQDWPSKLSSPWSGLFRLRVPDELPQMPLSLTVADGRSPTFQGRVVGFGPDQETSTTEAALEALRQHCDGPAGTHGDGPAGTGAVVGAAGRSQTEAMLDGALRLLATKVEDTAPIAWLGVDDPVVRRLWRTVEEHELTPVDLSTGTVAGFSWPLVVVQDQRGGARLGAGWGPTQATAARAALSGALATTQVRRTIDASYVPPATGPGFIEHLHGAAQEELAAAVTAWLSATGQRLSGHRLGGDAVSGEIGAWCGSVWLDG